MSNVKRREVLAGLAAIAVSGFDTAKMAWVSEASASSDSLPRLDGRLVFDPAVRASKSTDVGNTVKETPFAVLQPGSVKDVAEMVKYCAKRNIKVAARGQGHTTFGQSLVGGGLSVDMSYLSEIHSIGRDRAEVGAGLRWRELVETTTPLGLAPPVLTGYIGLSIGGTLSVGGISSGNRRGAQVDHVLELEVVTGEGKIVRCSKSKNSDLFEAALAGLGQCGIITRAVIELVKRPPLTRTYALMYVDNATFFADQRTLLEREEFDDIFTLFFPDGAGGWLYQLNAVKYYDAAHPPDDARLLRGLSPLPGTTTQDTSFLDYATRVDAVIGFFAQIGLWEGVIHPWFDVFLPGDATEEYVGDVLPTLTPDDVGAAGFMLLFPLRRSAFHRRFLRLPDGGDRHGCGTDEYIFLFDILTAAPAPGPNPEFAAQMLERNRVLFDAAADVGGYRYPIGSLEFSKQDWRRHYGDQYAAFRSAKQKFDPKGILTPGPQIF
jgi:FAD/FMN-containing dehydrogenase